MTTHPVPTGPAPDAPKAPGEPYLLTRRDRIRIEALRLATQGPNAPHRSIYEIAMEHERWITRD